MPRAKSRTRKSKNGRNGKKDQSDSSSPSGSTIMIDEKMKQTEWAKQSHTLEFAEKGKDGGYDCWVQASGVCSYNFYSTSGIWWILTILHETCRTDIYEYPDIVLASLNDFMSGTVSDKALRLHFAGLCVDFLLPCKATIFSILRRFCDL